MGRVVQIEEIKVEQGTEEWFLAKKGYISASSADLLLVKGKSEFGLGSGLLALIDEKVAELLTLEHDVDSGFLSRSAQRGVEEEPFARYEYERRNLLVVEETGFIRSKGYYFGFSPDGLVRCMKKGVEIKNFDSKNHIQIVTSGIVPKKVYAQCQFSMMVNDYETWDAVFYDRRVVPELQYRQFEIPRNEEMIKEMRAKAIIASNIISEKVGKYISGILLASQKG